MSTVPTQNLEMLCGDTFQFTITVTRAGSPVNLTGASLWVTAKHKKSDLDSQAVFQLTIGSGIVVTDAAGGIAAATVVPSNTTALRGADTSLYFDVQLKESGGATTSTLVKGDLLVEADVTHAA